MTLNLIIFFTSSLSLLNLQNRHHSSTHTSWACCEADRKADVTRMRIGRARHKHPLMRAFFFFSHWILEIIRNGLKFKKSVSSKHSYGRNGSDERQAQSTRCEQHVAGKSEWPHQASMMDLCLGNGLGGSNNAAQWRSWWLMIYQRPCSHRWLIFIIFIDDKSVANSVGKDHCKGVWNLETEMNATCPEASILRQKKDIHHRITVTQRKSLQNKGWEKTSFLTGL